MRERIKKYKQYYKDGVLYKMICRKVVNKTRFVWIAVMKLFPIQDNKICFDNMEGTGYGGDSKYIYQELVKRDNNLRFIWFVREKKNNMPKEIKQVNIDSVAAIYHQSTAKIWVDNTRTGHRTQKRTGQYYVQTWHANILAKKIEKDAEDKLWDSYIPLAKYDGQITDAFIVANKTYYDLVKSSFWLNKNAEVLKIGSPSNDGLLVDNDNKRIELRNINGIKENEFVILYAPSFRDDLSVDGYKIDFNKILSAFELMTKKECKFYIRFHPDVQFHSKTISYNEKMVDMTSYPDVKELAIMTDALITDYSSIAYDYLLLRKPIFRLCLDFGYYKSLRDVYDEFYKMPYSLCFTNEALYSEIKKFSLDKYREDLQEYYDYNTFYDNGFASKKAVDWILKHMK